VRHYRSSGVRRSTPAKTPDKPDKIRIIRSANITEVPAVQDTVAP
jgi:hypothetical protein